MKIKVLFVIRTLLRAGAERLVVNISNELVKYENVEVAIFTVHAGNEFQNELNDKIKVIEGNVTFHFSLYKKNKFDNQTYIDFVSQFQPNIIHSHLFYGDLLSHTYFVPEVKYFSHQHNSEVPEYKKFNCREFHKKSTWTNYYEFTWLKRKFRQHKTTFIACSAGTEEMLRTMIGSPKIVTLPNSIPLPINNYEVKESIGSIVKLLWIGRLSEVKRPQLAIEIALELKKRKINFQLKIVGDGVHFENCQELISNFGLQNEVKMLGIIGDVSQIYQNSNVLLHTAQYEGLPMVFIEANSYGIPIISSDCMPKNELLIDGKNGLLVRSDEPVQFANAIEGLLKTQGQYEQMSKGAIEVSKGYGIENYVKKLLDLYTKG